MKLTLKTIAAGFAVGGVIGYTAIAIATSGPSQSDNTNTSNGVATASNDAAQSGGQPVDNGQPNDTPVQPITTPPHQDVSNPAPSDGTTPSDPGTGAAPVNVPPPDTTQGGTINQPNPTKTLTGTAMHYVDVSPAANPNTVAQEYCDYTYSDGSSNSVLNGTYTENFTQPIADYNQNNLPKVHGVC